MIIRDILNLKGNAIFSIGPGGKVSEAVSMMVKEGDKLLGVISFHDVANAVIQATSFHNRLLKSYIKNWPEEESAK